MGWGYEVLGWVTVEGRRVKIASGIYTNPRRPGKTMTVNICTAANVDGNYEQVYRGPLDAVTVQDVDACRSRAELDALMSSRSFRAEGPRRPRR